jgi:hypothetical protein
MPPTSGKSISRRVAASKKLECYIGTAYFDGKPT